MPTYLYCVLPETAEAPPLMPVGVGGGLTRILRADAISAWVETVPERTLTPTIERVRAHDAVTETALLSGATPLPARFGQIFESDTACLEGLRTQKQRLLADLDEVRDLVEMRVIVALALREPASADADASSPGVAYMRRLMDARGRARSAEQAATAVRDEVKGLVGQFVRREAWAIAASPAILTLTHLVARDDASAYRAALDAARLGSPTGPLVVRGPGAPYQFVSPPA